jgi:hypothetical protein
MAEEDCREEQASIFEYSIQTSIPATAYMAEAYSVDRVICEKRIPGTSIISVSERHDVVTRWLTRNFEALPNAFNRGDLSIRCRSFTSFG